MNVQIDKIDEISMKYVASDDVVVIEESIWFLPLEGISKTNISFN